jgi:hypothetical protein
VVLKNPIEGLRDAIRDLHHCESVFRSSTLVLETTSTGVPTARSEVVTFDLLGHPRSDRCYAWADGSEKSDRTRLRFFVVLHEAPFDSAAAAYRAVKTRLALGAA